MCPKLHAERGNVLFMILIAVVLLAALSYTVAKPGGEQASATSATRISEDVKSQAQTIRSALMECLLVHNIGYPAEPVSGLVADLQCQVDDAPTYQALFSGTANRFLPQPPKPFTSGWTYDIDAATNPDTISIALTRSINCTADQGVKSAMDVLATQFSAAEAQTVCNGTTASFTLYIVKGT